MCVSVRVRVCGECACMLLSINVYLRGCVTYAYMCVSM